MFFLPLSFLRVFRLLAALALPLLLPAGLLQAQTIADADLVVVVRDGAGAPLPGLAVVVRDAGGQQELGRATTDARGQAAVARLIESDVRVVVAGTLPGGIALTQRGNDARGIPVLIGAPPTTLLLRVGSDGLVAPDATMFSPERGGIPTTGTPITEVDLSADAAPPAPRVGGASSAALPQVAPAAAGVAAAGGDYRPGTPPALPASVVSPSAAVPSGWPWGLLLLVGLGLLGVVGGIVYLRDQGGR